MEDTEFKALRVMANDLMTLLEAVRQEDIYEKLPTKAKLLVGKYSKY